MPNGIDPHWLDRMADWLVGAVAAFVLWVWRMTARQDKQIAVMEHMLDDTDRRLKHVEKATDRIPAMDQKLTDIHEWVRNISHRVSERAPRE